ncbi:MAG: SigB/SigF/SigG family RNA polymerase sigma factor [bacterium]|nr:SigB/SigF/SigG family RNA polymerase sigma factor [bacterium]MDY4099526.1 SigB/SigF/SigG family RNA polymerase sigma factor [Lachnospiraceae bacterium]
MEHTMELLLRAKNGDKDAGEQLVEENLGLVGSVVRRFENRGYDREDLFQIGAIGLMKAIEKFDFSYEVRFSTYAVPLVMGEIRRFLRDDGMMKVSRSIKESGWRVKKSREKLEQQLGRSVTIQELSDDTGLSMEEIALALDASEEVTSIYQTVYQSDGSELYLVDKVADDEPQEEQLLNRVTVQQLLKTLAPEEQKLIRLRYFEGKTQSLVAADLGMTQVQVSRSEKKILQKMRLLCEKT